MGVFDNLNRQIGNDPDDDDTGLNPADIANLPSPQKEIMRLILSEIEMSLEDLIYEYADDIPTDELITVLDGLAADQWLIKYGEENIVYEINSLRRKGPSKLGGTVWGGLSDKISAARQERLSRDEEEVNDE